ncbi:MAG: RodZ domain-containing protein [Acetobacteraceae bacterium]
MCAQPICLSAALAVALSLSCALSTVAAGEPPPAGNRIVVAATGDDWISVADASGHVILARLLHKGDKLALPEGPGFVFTAGNAAATTLLVDGQAAARLGAQGQVVNNQPLDAALIAAGRLPAQLAPAGKAHVTTSAPSPTEPASDPAPGIARAAVQPSQQAAAAPSDGGRSAASRIVVAASGDDWISVSDASGRRILGRLLHKGEELALPQGPGFVLTAGNAAATILLVDGAAAPPLGKEGQVVSNQPLDPALIAAGRLPAQLAASHGTATARVATAAAARPAPRIAATQAAASPAIAPASSQDAPAFDPLQKVAMVVAQPMPAPAVSKMQVAPAVQGAARIAASPRPVAMVVPLRRAEPSPPVAPPAAAPLKPAGVQQSIPAVRRSMRAAPPTAFASADPSSLGRTIALRSGSGQVISLAVPAASVFTADPKVADVRPASPTSLFVLGIAPGETTIAALDQSGHPIAQYRVIVTPSAYGPDAAAAAISRLVPGAQVSLSALPNGLTVSGTVATPADAAKIMSLVTGFAGPKQTVHNELNVLADVQVSLQVRIAEMSRTITRELGVNWQELGTTGGKITANFMAPSALAFLNDAENTFNLTYHSGLTNVNSVIDALAQDQLARLLAEPNLTAMSGQTASFLVGGEFPIPVSEQNGEISIQFQPYGVSLSFIPTVLADNRISLRVRPEVSELTDQGAVQLSEGNSTIQIPALLVRRAETTVELGSGQSFAIAGLLQDQTTQVDQGLPGLSEIPILGALFNSNSFQRQETELVIIVTPYIVRPVSRPSLLRLPTDNWSPPSDLDRILFHRQEALGNSGTPVARIPGDAGFIAQ